MLIQRLFKRLQKVGDTSVDRALAVALPTADSARRREIALLLLARREPASAAALIIHFPLLPADVRTAIVAQIPHLAAVLRSAGRVRDAAGCERVVAFIRQAPALRFADILAEQLRAPSLAAREAAALGLLELTQLHADAATGSDPRDPLRLRDAIADAVSQFRHHHLPAVLLALANLLPRPCPEAVAAIADPKHPAHAALRQLIADAREPAILRQFFLWLTLPELMQPALQSLPRLLRSAGLGHMLSHGHLLALGPVRKALMRFASPESIEPTPEQLAALPAEAQRHLPAFLVALHLPRDRKAVALAGLAAASDPLARLVALRQLIQLSTAAPVDPAFAQPPAADAVCRAIEPFCRDADPDIARIAVRHLLALRFPGLPRLLLHLSSNSPHEAVRELAARHLAPTAFAWLWRHWPRLPVPRRLAAAKALIKLGDHLHTELARRLAHHDRATQLRAADMIAQLNQGELFEAPLIALARGSDTKLAATAVRALASAQSQDATDVLEASLAHRDTRVRANAVEALSRHRVRRAIGQLRAIASTDENRPRANAIGQLLSARDEAAVGELHRMLADPRQRHRISALWLVERADRIDTAGEVAEMALADPDADVRKRAAQTLRQLVATMRKPLLIEAPAGAVA